jgi:signal transduction histidine kinase
LLVDTVRTYASSGDDIEIKTEKVDLNEMLPALFPKLKLLPSVGSLASLTFKDAGARVMALVDVKKFEQVLLNLVRNAAEAAPKGEGKVELTLRSEKGRAFITVRDNGPGVPDEVIDRVWSGFYTTKGDSGTGLGLLVSRKIIRAHAGDISFSYRPDQGGATLTIDLPVFGS